jgi:phage terminase large subunit
MPKMRIPEKLLPLLRPKRFKIVVGGRGSAKSTTVADMLILKAQTEAKKVMCLREYQNSIEDSVHALLKAEINRMGATGFEVLKTSLEHSDGGQFKFRGLARSLDGIKSSHGFSIFWTEEAQFLSDESIQILTPTVREAGSELWMTGNPMSSSDPFSQRFIVPYLSELQKTGYYEDDLHMIIFINYPDNPFFPEVLEQSRQHDYKTLDRALYNHIWLGAFNDHVADSIIKADWFDACIDAHLKLGFKPVGAKVAAHDPSDLGPDDRGYALRHGSVIMDVDARSFGDVNYGCDWALDKAINSQVDYFVWDADGLGASLRRQITDALGHKHIIPLEFRGSNSVSNPDQVYQEPGKSIDDDPRRRTNKDVFKNNRAQKYWNLRDRIFNTYLAITQNQYNDPATMISFSSTIERMQQLRSEVCRIPRRPDPNGMIQIMSKPDMKRLHKLPSPNLADSVMMTLTDIQSPATSVPQVQHYIAKNRRLKRMFA